MKHTIIGAGIGGLTTALAFEKEGIDYKVFEKAHGLNDVGAGIWLAPNALQVLDYLEVLNLVRSKGKSIDRITIAKHNLEPLSDTWQDPIKAEFGFTSIAIHRAELQQLLFDSLPSEKIHFGKGFKTYKELSNGKIKIICDDNSEHETDILIGADGINSKVRAQLFPKSSKRYSGQTCWRGVAALKLEKEFQHRGLELWGHQVRFGISQLSNDHVYWFAVSTNDPNQTDKNGNTKNKLKTLFKDFPPLINNLINTTPIDAILRHDIYDLKPLSKWYRGNICLIGDAGHATTPNLGQGGAQAIEDAYYLTHFIKQFPNQNIFESFQQKRQDKVTTIVNQSWLTGQMAHWKYGRGLRNLIIKTIPKRLLEKKLMALYKIEKVL